MPKELVAYSWLSLRLTSQRNPPLVATASRAVQQARLFLRAHIRQAPPSLQGPVPHLVALALRPGMVRSNTAARLSVLVTDSGAPVLLSSL